MQPSTQRFEWFLCFGVIAVIESLSDTSTAKPVSLSEDEKLRLASRGRAGLFRLLFWQFLVALIVAAMFLVFSDTNAFISALVGSACYLVPNTVFVLRLALSTLKPKGAGAGLFLVGNGLKLLVAGGLLWLVADVGGSDVNWLAVLVGLIAALKGHWLGMLVWGKQVGKMI